jgi:hypothetical protein
MKKIQISIFLVPTRVVLHLKPEYYTHPNESQKAVVAAYKSYCKDLLKMVGNDDVTATEEDGGRVCHRESDC